MSLKWKELFQSDCPKAKQVQKIIIVIENNFALQRRGVVKNDLPHLHDVAAAIFF